MSQNIFRAIIQGPKDAETAKKVVKITIYLLLFSAVVTFVFSVAGFFKKSDIAPVQYMLDPFALIDVGLMLILAFFIYKQHLWAAITLVGYQFLSSYVVYSETGHIPSAIIALKILLFISTARGIYLLKKQVQNPETSNA